MNVKATLSQSPPTTPSGDQFRYGWRFVRRVGANGEADLEQVPLTLEDVLHPQEGDVIPVNRLQHKEVSFLYDVFEERLPRLRSGLVLADCLVDWGVPHIRNH